MNAQPKQTINNDGLPTHYSVGAIIGQGDKYLLIDRMKPPLGFASIAGHVDKGEEPETSLAREILEESGLQLLSYEKIVEETLSENVCSRGVGIHHWIIYKCETKGEIYLNKKEVRSINWYSVDEIKKLNLEPVWKYWFEKFSII